MSFPTNRLPDAFEEDHGSIDLDDAKPSLASSHARDDADDEDLALPTETKRVWLCKVPRFLMDRWSQQQHDGNLLGRVRVYDEKGPDGQPKIALLLNDDLTEEPANTPDVKGKRPAATAADGVPTEYKLTMQNANSKNLYLFGERIEDDVETGEEGARKKRRKTSLLGTVAHECSLTPSIQSASASAAYARILRERQRKAAEPRRTLKRLDVDQAQANRMASGMGTAGLKGRGATFANTSNRGKAASGGSLSGAPRQTRLPKNELLDLVFPLFAQAPYWHLRALNDHVHQPQTYLREVLNEIAILVPKGPYAQMWALRPEFKQPASSSSSSSSSLGLAAPAPAPAPSGSSAGSGESAGAGGQQAARAPPLGGMAVKREPDADDDDDDNGDGDGGGLADDDDDDLEMVS
ncbi:hypothetical protein JCM3770_006898 [Rhodotorula araucariae]